MRLRIKRPPAIVVAIAARIASRDSRPPRVSRYFRNADLPPRASIAASIASGRGSSASASVREEQRARLRVDRDPARVEGLVAAVLQAGMGEEVDQRPGAGERPLDAFRPGDERGRRHHRVRRVAGVARRVGRDEDRVADQVHLGRHRHVEQRPVVLAGDLVHQRQREAGLERQEREVEHLVPVHARHLGLRVHHRGARLVLHVLPGDDGADLAAERRDLRRHRARAPSPAAARSPPAAAGPGRCASHGFSDRLPRGAKSRLGRRSAPSPRSAPPECRRCW